MSGTILAFNVVYAQVRQKVYEQVEGQFGILKLE